MNRNNSNTADRMEEVDPVRRSHRALDTVSTRESESCSSRWQASGLSNGVDGGQVQDVGRGFRFGVCALFVLAWLVALSIGVAQAAETTLVGTNDPTVDLQAIQDAVDNFDVVNLEGTFHLGDEATPYSPTNPRGSITITRAGLTLRGEGKDATRIVGGGCTYPGPTYFPVTIYVDGADAVKIHDLTVEGYLGCAIAPVDCEHFESIGVRITNGANYNNRYRYGWHFFGMTGDVLIEDCEYSSFDVTGHWEDGICSYYGNGDANFTIINNTFELGSVARPITSGDGSDAIQIGTTEDAPVGHTARIEGNTLVGGTGVYIHHIRSAEIRNNRITASQYGVLVSTPSPEECGAYIIEKNSIRMEGGSAAIQGWIHISPWACAMTVSENILSGSADVGFLLEGSAQGNRIVIDAKDVEDFTATTAHVSLGPDTRHNLFSLFDGADLVIVDQGANNAFVYPAHVASATMTPGLAVAGQPTPLEVTVVLDVPLEATERMILDFSPVGIPSELPLFHDGEGRYTLSTTVTPLRKGQYCLLVLAETAEGDRQALAAFTLVVYPEGDLSIYEDGPGTGWTVEVTRAESDPTSSKFVRSGSFSHAILLMSGSVPGNVKYVLDDPAGIDPFGYTHLEFYVNGGEASGQNPLIAGKRLSDLGVVPQSDTWTLVSIPISEVALVRGRLTRILIGGRVGETFYLDDMKFVAQEIPSTAVEEASGTTAVPLGYALSQNYPNPFNPQTMIRYDLPQAGAVRLSVYNALGQMVRTLVDDPRPAGSYSVVWDGRDATGRDVASGVYLYRIQTDAGTITRKMMMLR